MKLIIAGSREVKASVEEIRALVEHFKLEPTAIISGKARGMDRCGEDYAKAYNLPVIEFPVTPEEWETIGPSAGHRRNARMALEGDALLLIWDGKSHGSAGMKKQMERLNKPVHEGIVQEKSESVQSKVEYVKSQGQTRKHHCHWPDCNENVPPAMWGCKKHWFKLPKRLRDRIWATYKPGQEVTMTPSNAYLKVAMEVQKWIEENK